MSDPQQGTPAPQGQKRDFAIPDSVRAKFPDLIALITASESMNDDERQYWFDILPIMSPEQLENLRSILANERTQLDAIDAKYAEQAQKTVSTTDLSEKRKTLREDLQNKEASDQSQEQSHEENILKEIEGL